MMDDACPVWRHVVPTHLNSHQVIQSKYLHSATGAPWYVRALEIHSDLWVPYIAEHIRSITRSRLYAFRFGEPSSSATVPRARVRTRLDMHDNMEIQLFQPNTECLLVWQPGWVNTRKIRWEMTHQNFMSSFSPDGVSLTVEAFSWSGPNYWAHNSEVSTLNNDHDQNTFALFRSVFSVVFSGCKANIGRLS